MSELLMVVQVALAGVLAWTCFCRLVKTNAQTLREVRWSIWFLGTVAGLVLGAPLLPLLDAAFTWPPGTTPAVIWVLLLLAIVMVQVATSRHWRDGTPDSFRVEC